MLNEVGGAGNFGTPKLTNRYKKDTPGQEPGKLRQIGYYEANVKAYEALPATGDSVNQFIGSPKTAGFAGDTTSEPNPYVPPSPVDKWMVKEDTIRRFREKYGKLAKQKIEETAKRLKNESLTDPYDGAMGATPNSWNVDEVRPPEPNFGIEKLSVYRKRKKTK